MAGIEKKQKYGSSGPGGASVEHDFVPSDPGGASVEHDFVHLNVHSNFSILRGADTVEGLVGAAAADGMRTLALTDTNGLYAAVPFQAACHARGIRPLFGAELLHRGARALVLAANRDGYAELCRLVTGLHLDGNFSLREALAGASGDLFVLADDAAVLEAAVEGGARVRVEVVLEPGPAGYARMARLSERARRLGVPPAASCRAFFLDSRGFAVHRLLSAIRECTTVGNLPPGALVPPHSIFRTRAAAGRLAAGFPGLAAETARIAAECRVELRLGEPRPPRFETPDGSPPIAFLEHLLEKGFRRRYGDNGDHARAALEKEFRVIEKMRLAEYFLICWDIVRYAGERGFPCLGRGSAANSLASYCLGITHVDPLAHNLFFERFLNEERSGFPDIDIDFGTDDREEVIKYVFRKYGRDRVAMICTYSTMRARASLREVAAALGIPDAELDDQIKRIPHMARFDRLEEVARENPRAAGLLLREEPFATVLRLARRIAGFPRHLATHPCGLVICPGPITDYMPLERGEGEVIITQWSMDPVEAAGLIKIDILGQKGLAVISEAAAMAAENRGVPVRRVSSGEYLTDPLTKEKMRRGATEGCFYIESPVMMQLLQQAGCDDFEVLTALSSIIRPGVSNYGGKQSYLKRHLGLEPVTYLHPLLEPILHDSMGCLIYQEQVIRIVSAVGGLSLAEADSLRRVMSGKQDDAGMEAVKERFLAGAAARGLTDDEAATLFGWISSFAGYAFCKAHSASFALESFESLYWKTHYPAEFMAAVLSNRGGYYSPCEYLEEARRIGLEILPPCVNRSGKRFSGAGRSLRVGLMQVKGLKGRTIDAIVEGRRFGPYRSLRDLLHRARPELREAEQLIRCGALASFGRGMKTLFWELRLLYGSGLGNLPFAAVDTPSLPGSGSDHGGGNGPAPRPSVDAAALPSGQGHAVPPTSGTGGNGSPPRAASPPTLFDRPPDRLEALLPDTGDHDRRTRLRMEWESLDLTVSAHPLALYEEDVLEARRRTGACRAVDLPSRSGRSIRIVGWPVTAKPTRTRTRGELMEFVTFSDETGRFEAVLFPAVYRRVGAALAGGLRPYLVRGVVETEIGYSYLNVRDLVQI